MCIRDRLYATLYATVVSSAMIDLLAGVYTFAPMEPMLAAIYGGVIVGLACGLMLRNSATTDVYKRQADTPAPRCTLFSSG